MIVLHVQQHHCLTAERQAIGALVVTLGGIDALVFTAGVGENASKIREDICAGLECLRLELDSQANDRCRPDADIARRGSQARILVIATREDVSMLREITQVLAEKTSSDYRQGVGR